VLAPQPSQLVDLPSAFGRRFLVSVDTEEEFDWSKPKRRDSVSVEAVRALPTAQARLKAAGIKPAYLMDYPIASNPVSVGIIRGFLEDGDCTIGAQLHPWVNPPFDEELDSRNSFPGNLPRALERAKLKLLTERLEASFGQRPTVYRAGRYGIGPNTEAILDELGYRIDCSVRPLFDYGSELGPSFWHAPAQPYWTGPECRLLEIPLSALFVGALSGVGKRLFRWSERIPRMRGVLARTGLLNRVVLTPEGMPLDETLEALRVLVDRGARIFSIAFHSPSVETGHTPFVRDAADLSRLYGWLDGVFDFFARESIRPCTPHDVLAAAIASQPAANRRLRPRPQLTGTA
jgi:hypothetical protein